MLKNYLSFIFIAENSFLCFAPIQYTQFCIYTVVAYLMENILHCLICLQMDSGQGDLGTLANVVTSLANLSDSLKENLNNGDMSDSQHEDQSASEITRSVSSAQRGGECVNRPSVSAYSSMHEMIRMTRSGHTCIYAAEHFLSNQFI